MGTEVTYTAVATPRTLRTLQRFLESASSDKRRLRDRPQPSPTPNEARLGNEPYWFMD